MAYSPPGTGGVAARQVNAAKPPLKAQTGWSVQNDHPVRAFLTFDGASTPPVPGGEYSSLFPHTQLLSIIRRDHVVRRLELINIAIERRLHIHPRLIADLVQIPHFLLNR